MTSYQIKDLLGKFFDETISDEEKNQLFDLFLSGDYPAEFAKDASLIVFHASADRMQRADYPGKEEDIKKIRSILYKLWDMDDNRRIKKRRYSIGLVGLAVILVFSIALLIGRSIWQRQQLAASKLERQQFIASWSPLDKVLRKYSGIRGFECMYFSKTEIRDMMTGCDMNQPKYVNFNYILHDLDCIKVISCNSGKTGADIAGAFLNESSAVFAPCIYKQVSMEITRFDQIQLYVRKDVAGMVRELIVITQENQDYQVFSISGFIDMIKLFRLNLENEGENDTITVNERLRSFLAWTSNVLVLKK